jgi:regulator of protease activity HflC (stomatin/prohibitin superfamily)
VKTGTQLIAMSTDAVYVDVKPVEYEVKFDDLMTKDGVPMHFDATVVTQVTDSVTLVKKFGPKWFENNVDSVFRNLVRQAVRKHGMNEVAIDTTAIDSIDQEVSQGLTAYITKSGLPVKIVRLTVGKANPPDAIKDQRVETAQQEQRQKTEGMKQAAEVARKQAELARAEADNAYRSQMSLSPEQFVELQRINMMSDVCTKGHGCTFIVGNGTALVGGR